MLCKKFLFSGDSLKFPGKDGDIIYSKNNVCVHPNCVDGEPVHVPGYMTLHCQQDEVIFVRHVEILKKILKNFEGHWYHVDTSMVAQCNIGKESKQYTNCFVAFE